MIRNSRGRVRGRGGLPQPMTHQINPTPGNYNRVGKVKNNRKEPESPLYTSIFIVCNNGYPEDEFKQVFSQYGEITNFRQQKKDERKVYTFITFSKASEAALAIEEMNGKVLSQSSNDRLKCMLAMSKESRGASDKNEEKGKRIFCRIPTDKTVEDLKVEFGEFGEIQNVKLLTNKENGKSRGLCFVTFKRPYCAAKALESVPDNYKPLFAEERPKTERVQGGMVTDGIRGGYEDFTDSKFSNYEVFNQDFSANIYRQNNLGPEPMSFNGVCGNDGFYDDNYEDMTYHKGHFGSFNDPYLYELKPNTVHQRGINPTDVINNFPNDGKLTLHVQTGKGITAETIEQLFRIVPSFESCAFDSSRGEGTVRYGDPACAAFARDRIDGFLFPNDSTVCVSIYKQEQKASEISRLEANLIELTEKLSQATTGEEKDNIQNILDNVIKATSLLKSKEGEEEKANIFSTTSQLVRVRYCAFLVPEIKEMVPQMECGERLFIVAKPTYFSDSVLRNLFCRYGNLIDAYFLPGKNYGFAKYGTPDSAQAAIEAINGKEVAGQLMRVVVADPNYAYKKRAANEADESEPDAKRPK